MNVIRWIDGLRSVIRPIGTSDLAAAQRIWRMLAPSRLGLGG